MTEEIRIKAKMEHPETGELIDAELILTPEQYDQFVGELGPFSIQTKPKSGSVPVLEETMHKDAIEVVHIKFDPSNPTWWRSRDEWVKDRTALWRERYPTAREQRRLRVRTYGELRTDELGKTWFHIDLVLERSGSDLISL